MYMYCISLRSFLLQVPPWHRKLRGKDGSKVTRDLLCYIYVVCFPAQIEQVSLIAVICVTFVHLFLNTLSVVFFVCYFSGAAFKTQKEVVKAIFVNNIERLGQHYARVFDESWWISKPVSTSQNVNKCIVTYSKVSFVFVLANLDRLQYYTDFLICFCLFVRLLQICTWCLNVQIHRSRN